MSVERHQQQQQQQHQQQPPQHQPHTHQQQQQQQQQTQQPPHHVHCSYEKDIVCEEIPTHRQQQSQPQLQQPDEQQHIHCHAHMVHNGEQQISTPHHHQHQQQQRKHSHSHSPHPSRHTSPHSHHSHSQHSSPHQSHHRVHDATDSLSRIHTTPRPSAQSSSSHAHYHHHHRRRRRNHSHVHHTGSGSGGGSGNLSTQNAVTAHTHNHSQQEQRPSSRHNHHSSACTRRHRSATDVSSTSVNTCHDPTCVDREVQEIFVRKGCCTSSRPELAQYFAEDLYGSSRRPSSCCTSSDYCYQTDSTSLYGSRSSLSRNNSIKSASVVMRKRRLTQRRPSYTSISLRGLNATLPDSELGSLTSLFDAKKKSNTLARDKVILSPSKVTIERQTSKDALSNDLPEYACSPSPIRWSFLADGKSATDYEEIGDGRDAKDAWKPVDDECREQKHERKHGHERERERERERDRQREFERERNGRHERSAHHSSGGGTTGTTSTVDGTQGTHQSWKPTYDERPSTSAAAARKCRDSPFSCDFEESTTVLFHQEGEAYNNCCNNYIQCNTYLDQDLQITSEDIHQYLSKGNQQLGDVLNNSKNYPFQPSNALEFQYKNNFANNNNNNVATSSEGGDSRRDTIDSRFRRNSSKETNLNQNATGAEPTGVACAITSSCSSTPLSPTNINLSSSTNNINIVFNSSCMERNANEVKFINSSRDNVVSSEAHHTGYLPYTYPTYDYTNMSANSAFDKPVGIDELPSEFASAAGQETVIGMGIGIGSGDESGRYDTTEANTFASDGQQSSALHSPVQTGVSFESFDAPSDHNLLSQRDSCQCSSTPRSPLSPASPASSCMSASINPAAASYVHHHQYQHCSHSHGEQQSSHHSPTLTTPHQRHQHHQPHHQHYHHQQHHHQQHFNDSLKFSNAFKKVRKRARKYTDFLRKK